MSELPEAEDFANQDALLENWNAFMDFRGKAQKALEEARNEKVIGKSLEAHLTIYPDAEVKELLESRGCKYKEDKILLSGAGSTTIKNDYDSNSKTNTITIYSDKK